MTAPTDLRRCSAWYTLNASGYSDGQLIDQSGKGHHMPLVAGEPIWNMRDGVPCADFTADWYFEGRSPFPAHGSCVFKFHTNATTAENLAIVTTKAHLFALGDHAGETPLNPWENYDRRTISCNGTSSRVIYGDAVSGPLVNSDVYTTNAWHVVAGGWNPLARNVKVKLDGGGIGISSPDPWLSPLQIFDATTRIGYLKAGGWAGWPTRHCSVAEIAFFHDDILLNQLALTESLIASWS